MPLERLIIHAGAGKCGSSTIQTSFSACPTIASRTGAKVAYGAISGDGRLLLGDDLRTRAMKQHAKYISSQTIDSLSSRALASLTWERQLSHNKINTLLLSREAWLNNPDKLRDHVLNQFSVKPKIIIFVRPQVEYLNSAWWQWGAWMSKPLDAWSTGFIRSSQWSERADRLRKVSGVERVEVRLLSEDVITDCLELMDCRPDAVPMNRSNEGLPKEILRLYQRHRSRLRPGPHASGIDFFLRNYLGEKGKSPWVIGPKRAQRIIEQSRESNERLLELLNPRDQERMRKDLRWWSADAYADRELEDWRPRAPNPAELDELTARLVELAFSDARNRI